MSRVYFCACMMLIGAVLTGCQATGPEEASKPAAAPAPPPKAVERPPPEERAPPEPPAPPAAASAPQPAPSAAPLDLKTAQQLLNKRGYKVGTPDGKLGPRTRQALRRFQTDQRLPVTGNLDRDTMDRLMTK